MTSTIEPCRLPDGALLNRYSENGGFADCYVTALASPVTQEQYVEAFYSSALFCIERRLIGWFAGRPATDADARALARGEQERFSAWRVEARAPDQLLLRDYTSRTRSWLMSAHVEGGTRLYFGSAVVPRADATTGERRLGFVFHALLGFHRVYSRVLLGAARAKLARHGDPEIP